MCEEIEAMHLEDFGNRRDAVHVSRLREGDLNRPSAAA